MGVSKTNVYATSDAIDNAAGVALASIYTFEMTSPFEERVHVVAYDAEWPLVFSNEAALVRRALGPLALQIEHFGSTAVPGLHAKPIVDMLVAADTLHVPDAQVNSMRDLGYECLGAGSIPGRVHFRKRGLRNFNVSVVLRDGDLWRDNLLLRDFLRAHHDAAARYAEIKCAAAEHHPDSLLRYSDEKGPFIRELLIIAQRQAQAA